MNVPTSYSNLIQERLVSHINRVINRTNHVRLQRISDISIVNDTKLIEILKKKEAIDYRYVQ
jgi:hypothetical protein